MKDLKSQQILNSIEEMLDDYKYDLAKPFKRLLEAYKSEENEKMVSMTEKEIMVLELATDKGNSKKYFKHRYVLEDENGEQVKYPDIDKYFDVEIKGILLNRVKETQNPILIARYSDVLWSIYNSYPHTSIAVDAYIKSSYKYFDKTWYFDIQKSLQRALQISCSINIGMQIPLTRLRFLCQHRIYTFHTFLCFLIIFRLSVWLEVDFAISPSIVLILLISIVIDLLVRILDLLKRK